MKEVYCLQPRLLYGISYGTSMRRLFAKLTIQHKMHRSKNDKQLYYLVLD